jgi:hypothetical protein
MRGKCLMTLAAALLLAACDRDEGTQMEQDAYQDQEQDQVLPYCGDEKAALYEIINGSPEFDPMVAALTPTQVNAVGFLEIGGTHMCTGTLVAPGVVLTAAHCLRLDPSYVLFKAGPNRSIPLATCQALSWHLHPGYVVGEVDHDLAVVLMAQDPAADGISPIPVHLSPVQSLLGLDVQAAGYGFTADGDNSNRLRWWVVLRIARETAADYVAAGDGTTGTCDGDSGGPLLWNHPTEGVRVFAALSLGQAHTACLGDSHYSRTDESANAAFIQAFLPADPCAGETAAGRCVSDSQVLYCLDGVLHEETCDPGEFCRMDPDGNYRCLEPGPCEAMGLDRAGTCTDDGHALWCEDGLVRDRDCGLCGQSCGWAGDALGYYCMD